MSSCPYTVDYSDTFPAILQSVGYLESEKWNGWRRAENASAYLSSAKGKIVRCLRVNCHLRTFYKDIWPFYAQGHFGSIGRLRGRLFRLIGHSDEFNGEPSDYTRGDGGNEIKESLSRNPDDPFPNLGQGARVLIAIGSTIFGAALATWAICCNPGPSPLTRIALVLLGCIISLLGQALAWPT